MRVVGLDIHRIFAEAVTFDGADVVRLGRVGMTRAHLTAFAQTLTHDDHIVIEATGNAAAVAEAIAPHVGRVVIANPRQVRLIAEARIKTDVIDATVLARLYASGFLPEVWVPDAATQALRRQVTRRMQIVRQRARLKTMMQSILHTHLVPPCPHADLLGPKGRSWLLAQTLPPDESDALQRHLREHERLTDDLRVIEREIARDALATPDAQRLMTVPGIDMVVAVGLLAAIGPVMRFEAPDKLVSYLGLNPTVHQSGEGRPRHGRISKQGRTHARTMLVEAAWQAVRGPGPLRAFYERVARRRGTHIAAVAVARKRAVIVWHPRWVGGPGEPWAGGCWAKGPLNGWLKPFSAYRADIARFLPANLLHACCKIVARMPRPGVRLTDPMAGYKAARARRQRTIATTPQMASMRPNGHAPCRKP